MSFFVLASKAMDYLEPEEEEVSFQDWILTSPYHSAIVGALSAFLTFLVLLSLFWRATPYSGPRRNRPTGVKRPPDVKGQQSESTITSEHSKEELKPLLSRLRAGVKGCSGTTTVSRDTKKIQTRGRGTTATTSHVDHPLRSFSRLAKPRAVAVQAGSLGQQVYSATCNTDASGYDPAERREWHETRPWANRSTFISNISHRDAFVRDVKRYRESDSQTQPRESRQPPDLFAEPDRSHQQLLPRLPDDKNSLQVRRLSSSQLTKRIQTDGSEAEATEKEFKLVLPKSDSFKLNITCMKLSTPEKKSFLDDADAGSTESSKQNVHDDNDKTRTRGSPKKLTKGRRNRKPSHGSRKQKPVSSSETSVSDEDEWPSTSPKKYQQDIPSGKSKGDWRQGRYDSRHFDGLLHSPTKTDKEQFVLLPLKDLKDVVSHLQDGTETQPDGPQATQSFRKYSRTIPGRVSPPQKGMRAERARESPGKSRDGKRVKPESSVSPLKTQDKYALRRPSHRSEGSVQQGCGQDLDGEITCLRRQAKTQTPAGVQAGDDSVMGIIVYKQASPQDMIASTSGLQDSLRATFAKPQAGINIANLDEDREEDDSSSWSIMEGNDDYVVPTWSGYKRQTDGESPKAYPPLQQRTQHQGPLQANRERSDNRRAVRAPPELPPKRLSQQASKRDVDVIFATHTEVPNKRRWDNVNNLASQMANSRNLVTKRPRKPFMMNRSDSQKVTRPSNKARYGESGNALLHSSSSELMSVKYGIHRQRNSKLFDERQRITFRSSAADCKDLQQVRTFTLQAQNENDMRRYQDQQSFLHHEDDLQDKWGRQWRTCEQRRDLVSLDACSNELKSLIKNTIDDMQKYDTPLPSRYMGCMKSKTKGESWLKKSRKSATRDENIKKNSLTKVAQHDHCNNDVLLRQTSHEPSASKRSLASHEPTEYHGNGTIRCTSSNTFSSEQISHRESSTNEESRNNERITALNNSNLSPQSKCARRVISRTKPSQSLPNPKTTLLLRLKHKSNLHSPPLTLHSSTSVLEDNCYTPQGAVKCAAVRGTLKRFTMDAPRLGKSTYVQRGDSQLCQTNQKRTRDICSCRLTLGDLQEKCVVTNCNCWPPNGDSPNNSNRPLKHRHLSRTILEYKTETPEAKQIRCIKNKGDQKGSPFRRAESPNIRVRSPQHLRCTINQMETTNSRKIQLSHPKIGAQSKCVHQSCEASHGKTRHNSTNFCHFSSNLPDTEADERATIHAKNIPNHENKAREVRHNVAAFHERTPYTQSTQLCSRSLKRGIDTNLHSLQSETEQLKQVLGKVCFMKSTQLGIRNDRKLHVCHNTYNDCHRSSPTSSVKLGSNLCAQLPSSAKGEFTCRPGDTDCSRPCRMNPFMNAKKFLSLAGGQRKRFAGRCKRLTDRAKIHSRRYRGLKLPWQFARSMGWGPEIVSLKFCRKKRSKKAGRRINRPFRKPGSSCCREGYTHFVNGTDDSENVTYFSGLSGKRTKRHSTFSLHDFIRRHHVGGKITDDSYHDHDSWAATAAKAASPYSLETNTNCKRHLKDGDSTSPERAGSTTSTTQTSMYLVEIISAATSSHTSSGHKLSMRHEHIHREKCQWESLVKSSGKVKKATGKCQHAHHSHRVDSSQKRGGKTCLESASPNSKFVHGLWERGDGRICLRGPSEAEVPCCPMTTSNDTTLPDSSSEGERPHCSRAKYAYTNKEHHTSPTFDKHGLGGKHHSVKDNYSPSVWSYEVPEGYKIDKVVTVNLLSPNTGKLDLSPSTLREVGPILTSLSSEYALEKYPNDLTDNSASDSDSRGKAVNHQPSLPSILLDGEQISYMEIIPKQGFCRGLKLSELHGVPIPTIFKTAGHAGKKKRAANPIDRRRDLSSPISLPPSISHVLCSVISDSSASTSHECHVSPVNRIQECHFSTTTVNTLSSSMSCLMWKKESGIPSAQKIPLTKKGLNLTEAATQYSGVFSIDGKDKEVPKTLNSSCQKNISKQGKNSGMSNGFTKTVTSIAVATDNQLPVAELKSQPNEPIRICTDKSTSIPSIFAITQEGGTISAKKSQAHIQGYDRASLKSPPQPKEPVKILDDGFSGKVGGEHRCTLSTGACLKQVPHYKEDIKRKKGTQTITVKDSCAKQGHFNGDQRFYLDGPISTDQPPNMIKQSPCSTMPRKIEETKGVQCPAQAHKENLSVCRSEINKDLASTPSQENAEYNQQLQCLIDALTMIEAKMLPRYDRLMSSEQSQRVPGDFHNDIYQNAQTTDADENIVTKHKFSFMYEGKSPKHTSMTFHSHKPPTVEKGIQSQVLQSQPSIQVLGVPPEHHTKLTEKSCSVSVTDQQCSEDLPVKNSKDTTHIRKTIATKASLDYCRTTFQTLHANTSSNGYAASTALTQGLHQGSCANHETVKENRQISTAPAVEVTDLPTRDLANVNTKRLRSKIPIPIDRQARSTYRRYRRSSKLPRPCGTLVRISKTSKAKAFPECPRPSMLPTSLPKIKQHKAPTEAKDSYHGKSSLEFSPARSPGKCGLLGKNDKSKSSYCVDRILPTGQYHSLHTGQLAKHIRISEPPGLQRPVLYLHFPGKAVESCNSRPSSTNTHVHSSRDEMRSRCKATKVPKHQPPPGGEICREDMVHEFKQVKPDGVLFMEDFLKQVKTEKKSAAATFRNTAKAVSKPVTNSGQKRSIDTAQEGNKRKRVKCFVTQDSEPQFSQNWAEPVLEKQANRRPGKEIKLHTERASGNVQYTVSERLKSPDSQKRVKFVVSDFPTSLNQTSGPTKPTRQTSPLKNKCVLKQHAGEFNKRSPLYEPAFLGTQRQGSGFPKNKPMSFVTGKLQMNCSIQPKATNALGPSDNFNADKNLRSLDRQTHNTDKKLRKYLPKSRPEVKHGPPLLQTGKRSQVRLLRQATPDKNARSTKPTVFQCDRSSHTLKAGSLFRCSERSKRVLSRRRVCQHGAVKAGLVASKESSLPRQTKQAQIPARLESLENAKGKTGSSQVVCRGAVTDIHNSLESIRQSHPKKFCNDVYPCENTQRMISSPQTIFRLKKCDHFDVLAPQRNTLKMISSEETLATDNSQISSLHLNTTDDFSASLIFDNHSSFGDNGAKTSPHRQQSNRHCEKGDRGQTQKRLHLTPEATQGARLHPQLTKTCILRQEQRRRLQNIRQTQQAKSICDRRKILEQQRRREGWPQKGNGRYLPNN